MNFRQTLNDILNQKNSDQIAWTTLADDITRSGMPKDVRELPILDFYRHINCAILQFGDYGFWGSDLAVGSPAKLVHPGEIITEELPDGTTKTLHKTQWGDLISTNKEGHQQKPGVELIEELEILKNIWLNSSFEEDESKDFEQRLETIEGLIGDDGIYIHTLNPSPVQQLLEFDMGVTNFNFLLADHPEAMQELLDAMHECRKQEYEILARRTPLPAIMPVENTSTTLISPDQYEKFSLKQISDYVDIIHKHDKKAILHMCGLLKDLLPIIKETGLDGINALTPPATGNTTPEAALDVFGEDFIILGGLLDCGIFQKENATKEEIWQELDNIYTPRIKAANFLLWAQADGISTPLEKFMAVKEWFDAK